MKAHINKDGRLIIEPENGQENTALKRWWVNHNRPQSRFKCDFQIKTYDVHQMPDQAPAVISPQKEKFIQTARKYQPRFKPGCV